MGLSGKIHNRVEFPIGKNAFHRRSVGDVCVVKNVASTHIRDDIREVRGIAGIREGIDVVHSPIRTRREKETNKIAADKAAAAGD